MVSWDYQDNEGAINPGSVLISGLVKTARTETLEDYLRGRTHTLGVIGFSSCFLKANLSRCSLYREGKLVREFKLARLYLRDFAHFRQPLVILVFLLYFIDILYSVIRLRRRFDLFIGMAQFSGLVGVILKHLGICKKTIYYCLDYYVPAEKFDFNSLFFVPFINLLDNITVRYSDVVWDISDNITEARVKYDRLTPDAYPHVWVPLGYSARLRRSRPLTAEHRWDIIFVGTVTATQGLQLLVEALPQILVRLPNVRVGIIGQGPYSEDFKSLVKKKRLEHHIHFYGFINDDEEVLNIVSESAIGVALWDVKDENAKFGDLGKIKLYAVCGIPFIVTSVVINKRTIEEMKAGRVIEYAPKHLIDAVLYLLEDAERLKEYKRGAEAFGDTCIADRIFDRAFQETFTYLKER